MKHVERIVILYPGETSSDRINKPANYALSRLLIALHERGDVPIHIMNWSKRYERYGNIEFIHFTMRNLLGLARGLIGSRNTLIISQTGAYHKCARALRSIMPGSRVLIRLGGVYFGKDYLESEDFRKVRHAHRRRLSVADMILSTADGTPVDLYMQRVGIGPDRYRKYLNGFPRLANTLQDGRQDKVLCIARLHPEKGVDYVLRSFACAVPRLRAMHTLVIVGDGPARDDLERLAGALGVSSLVEFVGYTHDIGPYLFSSKLLVSGLGNNTLMEAIATGTPVIALDLGETRELYGHFPNVHVVDYPPGGYGRISVAHLDAVVRETADGIVRVLNDYPSRGGTMPPRADTLYGWDQRVRDELDLYEQLLALPVRV